MASFNEAMSKVGNFGRYQKFIYLLVCFCHILTGFHMVIAVFLTGTPDHRYLYRKYYIVYIFIFMIYIYIYIIILHIFSLWLIKWCLLIWSPILFFPLGMCLCWWTIWVSKDTCRQGVFLYTSVDTKYCGWLRPICTFKTTFKNFCYQL